VVFCAGEPAIGKSSPVVFGAKGDPHPHPHPLHGRITHQKRPSNSSIPPNEDLQTVVDWENICI